MNSHNGRSARTSMTAAETGDWRVSDYRIPYALRRLPESAFGSLVPLPASPAVGDVALARVEKLGKNTTLELANGRRCALHEGDVIAVVFGNRYATEQFEAYVGTDGDRCDLLSMGGLCGLVRSRHVGVSEPTRLRLLGALGNAAGNRLHLSQFALPKPISSGRPRVIVVCGTSMDAGKTYTAMSLIVGLKRHGKRVAAMKLTGTACGKDSWSMADAGASPVLDFVDGGCPSTYRSSLQELLSLHELLCAQAAAQGAEWVVIEVADGVLQQETAALLQCPRFTTTVEAWVFATGDPVAALGGVQLLREWGIEPLAISGLISQSPLAMREAEACTGVKCHTAKDLQHGSLLEKLDAAPASERSAYCCIHDLDAQPGEIDQVCCTCATADETVLMIGHGG